MKRLPISLPSGHISNEFTVYPITEEISNSDVRVIIVVHIPENTRNEFSEYRTLMGTMTCNFLWWHAGFCMAEVFAPNRR